jgi:predicted AAA+ superfamily ATPase
MLKVVFTGSSLLQILNARADLSRRAITYTMQGLSFREYLSIETGQHFDKLTLESILVITQKNRL